MTWTDFLTPEEAARLKELDELTSAQRAERHRLYERARKRQQRATTPTN